MARLVYEITGDVTGLKGAETAVKGILNNLKSQADGLKLKLFGAETVSEINGIGGALQIVTGKIKEYTDNAIRGSQAFKDQSAQAAIDALNVKLSVLTGNAQLFGNSIKNSQDTIRAYQSAINSLLTAGFDPLDTRIQSFRGNIDSLTASINRQKEAAKTITDPYQRFQATGSLILDAENKVKNLTEALRRATSTRDIALYNNRLKDAQSELERLRGIGLKTADATNRINQSVRAGSGGFNSFGVEIGRVVQDLPYAANNFGSIGNNITRIVELAPGYVAGLRATIVAQGGVATTANLARAGLASLFTGFGAISLAISAAVTAYTIFQMRQQTAAREAKETAKEIGISYEDLQKSVKSLANSDLLGAVNAGGDLSKLQQLYSASQDLNIPLRERKKIVDQLQAQYPSTFKALSDEAILSGKASGAYENLNKQLIAKSILQANTENLANALKPLLLAEQGAVNTTRRIAELQNILANPFKFGIQGVENARKELEKINSFAGVGNIISEKNKKDLKQRIDDILAAGNRLVKEFGAGILTDENKGGGGGLERQISLLQQLQDILNKGGVSAGKSGLEGYALEVQNINDNYDNLINLLDRFDQKVRTLASAGKIGQGTANDLLNRSAVGRTGLDSNRAKELADARIKEEERVANEVTRIQNEFGVRSAESKAKELAAIQARYDAEVVKAKGNSVILNAIEQGRLAAVQGINDKYEGIQNDIQAKILGIQETTIAKLTGREEDYTNKINKEWESRRAALNKYYADLIKITQADGNFIIPGVGNSAGLVTGILQGQQGRDNANLDSGNAKEVTNFLNKDFNNALKGVSTGFVSNLRQGLFNASSQAEFNFKSVFSNITTSFSQTIEQGIFNVLQSKLEKKLQQGIENGTSGLGPALQNAVAGLAVAGGLISGLTPKTSIAGQGIGGALSGAASGAVIGSAIPGIGTVAGGVIGGLVGAIGGIFGASNAKKQQELQQKQLEEAKKQTDLLRQSIAYTSQVIGRMTVNGIVSGVDVNAFGELKTRIEGKDIAIVLQRSTGR